MRKTILLCVLAVGLALTGLSLATLGEAFADDAGVALDAGPGSGSGSAIQADDLDDPVLAPAAAFDDAKALHKIGWPLLLLGCLIMLTKGLRSAGKKWPWAWLSWINAGYRATALAGALTVGSAAFNTLALGGTWFAVLVAAGGALLMLFQPTPATPAPTQAA